MPSTRSPEKEAWHNMHVRVLSPRFPYHFGLTVCDRWMSFENFLADMGPRPPGHGLDRRDGSKGYDKDNCRWATRKEQQRNICTNVMITLDGQTRCVSEWCELRGIKVPTAFKRLQLGWSHERTFQNDKASPP